MSGSFSDDLSDPTPSPPPPVAFRSSTSNKSSTVSGNNGTNNNTRRGSTATSKATTHQRTTSSASASASTTTRVSGTHGHKGVAVLSARKTTAFTSLPSASHSRTASLANSLVLSQSGGKGTMVNGAGARSDDDDDDDDDEEEEDEEEDGSQSGSELSSPPSEGEGQPKRDITEEHLDVNDEANEEENEEGEEDEGEDDEKVNDEDEDDNEEDDNPFAARLPPRHGRTASGGAGPGIPPPRATRQSSLRSASAAGRTGRGVIPAGMWEWAKKKNSKKTKNNKSDDDNDDGSEGEEGDEDEEDEDGGAGAHEGRPADSRDESLVHPAENAADEDEPMLNGTTNQHSPNGTFNSDDDVTTQHLPIPTVKIEPPPSATVPSFRPQDLGPSPSVSPAPTPAPTGPSERRTNGRSKTSGRTNSKRSHRPPPAPKRSTAAQQQQLQQLQLQQQQLQDAEDDAEAEEVERANRDMEAAEDAEEGEDDEGELEGEGEYGNRHDALDALSLLELKFALVRQRIYQDKMEELGREERFVKDGSHPELLHTYIELDKRKERRATLADLKRKREVDLAAVTRTNDEDAVWSWWMIQKDVVQSTLITEASRKRRRVERERRALLDPLRRNLNRASPPPELPGSRDRDGDDDMLPSRPSTKAILAVALRHPYARLRTYDSAQIAKIKLGENALGPAGVTGGNGGRKPQESMPALSQLDQGHINEDLEVLLGYRRGSGALGAVITAGAGPGMPDGAVPGGMGGPGGMYGAPGMDNGMSGTVTVNNAAVAPPPEAFNLAEMVELGDPAPGGGMLDYQRSIYELEQRERGRNREGQAFNDHLAAHQYSSTGMPPNGGSKDPTNGRERERERERPGSKKYTNSNAPSMGYVGGPPPASQQHQQQRERKMHVHSGYAPHSHRQAMDPYASPGLGLQNMQRLPDTGNPRDRDNGMGGIQHMPLPPAPSTIPAGSSSGASKHHHHHPAPSAPAHPQANQHPSLMWEGGRREREREREREGDLARERSHSGASRNPGMSGSGYATNPGPPSGNGGVSSSSGRSHSHTVSHQHQHAHYHPTHTHSRSSAQGSTPHTHSHSVLHTHPHSHSHATGSTSHLHVIHNHGPGPTGNGGSAGGNGAGGPSSSSSSRRNNAYEEGASASSGHRARTSYPSGPAVDREKELRERERLAGAVPSMNVMHPSLSHAGGQERDRHAGYAIPHSSRDSWNERDRDRARPKERDDRRDQDRERAGHSQGSMSGFSGHQPLPLPPQQQQQQQGGGGNSRGSRSGSLSTGMHPSQGNGYSQSQVVPPGSRYPYANSSAYSPPATQASQSRRKSPPPPSLPPVPNTSRYSSGSSTHRRTSPSPTDPLSYSASSQAQTEIAAIHSPTSSLNPPGFNPWSAPPRSSGRPYRPSPPPQKITPPTGTSFNSSAGGGPLNTLPGPTLSPILQSAVSPAPRPSISPAPRPPSSSSLHAILQPPPRENVLSPQPAKRNGSGSGSGEGGSGVAPMELDPPVQQQQTGFRHPSLAPLNHDGK